MEEEEGWPSARWKFLGCPFTDEEKRDIEIIEQEILESKLKRKQRQITSRISQSTFPHPSQQTENQNWIQTFNEYIAAAQTESSQLLSDELSEHLGKSSTALEANALHDGNNDQEETRDEAKITEPSTSTCERRDLTKNVEESELRPFSVAKGETLKEYRYTKDWLNRIPQVQFVKKRQEKQPHAAREEKKTIVKPLERVTERETVSEEETDRHIGPQRETDTHSGPEHETDTHSGKDKKRGIFTAPLLETDTGAHQETRRTDPLGSQRDTDTEACPRPDTDTRVRETDTHIDSERGTIVTVAERDAIQSEEINLPGQILTRISDTLTQQIKKFGYYLQPSLTPEHSVTEPDSRLEKVNKAAKLIRIVVSTDIASDSSHSGSTSASCGTLLPYQDDLENIQRQTLQRVSLLPTKYLGKRVSDRDSFWFSSPGRKPAKKKLSSSSGKLGPYQTSPYISESLTDSDDMSSSELSPGPSAGKPSGAKERREKGKGRREKEKEKREERKEKERERREKEKERREKEKKEREEREKDRKGREERERKEKDKKEREERERREREAAGVVTQATPPPTPGSEEGSEHSGQHGFFWRLFHTFVHLLFICLLLLTIGSLGVGVSSLFAKSALEVAQHFQQGMSQKSYMELCLALVGFVFFLLILALTVLSAVMLIPALWVSLIEIIVCPWSVISDYFLP